MDELFFKGKSLSEMSVRETKDLIFHDLSSTLDMANTMIDDLNDSFDKIVECHGEVFLKKVLVEISNNRAASILGKAKSLQRKINDIKNIIHTRRCKKINSKDCF